MVTNRIRNLLSQKKMSVAYLCRQLDLNRGFIRDVEVGKCSIKPDSLKKIAKVLDTTVEYLNGETDDPTRPDGVEYEALPKMDERKKALLALFDALSEEGKEKLFHSAVDLMGK